MNLLKLPETSCDIPMPKNTKPPKSPSEWEENQKKKECLNGYKDAKRKVRRIEEQIQTLRMDKMFPSIQYDDMPHGSNMTDLSNYAARVDELIAELGKEKLEAIRQYEKIYKDIGKLKDEREREVLTYKYIQELSWEDVCTAMNLGHTHTHRIHGSALKNFKSKEGAEK
ncbi:MAG: DUF1492 domain-containing protein [Lachnospiraceae bacterium]